MKLKRFSSLFMSCLLAGIIISSCNKTKKNKVTSEKESCITSIIKEDDSLDTIRINTSKEISLNQTITDYLEALEKLDYTQCPKDFVVVFNSHLTAWQEMLPITDKYSRLRGEIHAIFDRIEQSKDSTLFIKRLNSDWNTWSDVEPYFKTNNNL